MTDAIKQFCGDHICGVITAILIALTSCIEVSKIKINPWSWLFSHIGNALFKSTNDKIDIIDTKIDELESYDKKLEEKIEATNARIDRDNAEMARTKILRFADEIKREKKWHSEEHFREILRCIDEYDAYCKEHPEFPNHYTEKSAKLISDTYDKCVAENSFL